MYVDAKQAQVKRSIALNSSTMLGEHRALLSIILHLLPGIVTGAAYFILRPLVAAAGYPPHMALVLAIPFLMIPMELGLLLYLGHKRSGHISLEGVVLYRELMPFWRYLVYVPPVFVASLIIIIIGSKTLDGALQSMVFSWMPQIDWNLGGGYTRPVLVVSFLLTALFVTVGESVVEELYFRGFLLPRMGYAGRGATVIHSFLFALYHIWQPWRLISIAFGMLPIVFTARRTRNIYVGMIAHILLNSFDVIFGVAFILAMRSG